MVKYPIVIFEILKPHSFVQDIFVSFLFRVIYLQYHVLYCKYLENAKKCMLIRKQNMHAKLLIALSKKELSEIEKCQYLMDSCNKICLSGVRH